MKRNLLRDAQSHYANAVHAILEHELYSSDELSELEMKLVRSSYRLENYGMGRRSLRRLLGYDVANSEPLSTRLNALVRIADWELLFAHEFRKGVRGYESALEIYRRAYEAFESEGGSQASLDAIFSPSVPVMLPAFLPNRLVSEQAPESTGYVDVTFDITRNGESENVEIRHATENATRAAEKDLVRLIKGSIFRPRATNGRFADSTPVVVRYYLDE